VAGKGNSMLIDNPDEMPSELEAEEAKIQDQIEVDDTKIPEKYRNKNLEDIIKMHQEAEKLIGKQAQEVGEVRKLADELIKQNLGQKVQHAEVEPEVDFFENPQKAIQSTVDRHPDVLAAKQAASDFKRMQIQQKLAQEHPDYQQISADPEFVNWVKSSNVRMALYAKADGEFDYDSANELLSTFKQLRGVKTKQVTSDAESNRKNSLRAASVDVGGSGESGKRTYRRADLIRLKMTDPDRYEALSAEIMQAYADGRVK
jgi:transcriptional regulator of acetoin/glycerol metabolism